MCLVKYSKVLCSMDLYPDNLFKIQVLNIILLAYFEHKVQQRFIET